MASVADNCRFHRRLAMALIVGNGPFRRGLSATTPSDCLNGFDHARERSADHSSGVADRALA